MIIPSSIIVVNAVAQRVTGVEDIFLMTPKGCNNFAIRAKVAANPQRNKMTLNKFISTDRYHELHTEFVERAGWTFHNNSWTHSETQEKRKLPPPLDYNLVFQVLNALRKNQQLHLDGTSDYERSTQVVRELDYYSEYPEIFADEISKALKERNK